MWTREELKTRAKIGLKAYYWYGFLVCFVAALLGAGQASAGPQLSLRYNRAVNQQIEQIFEDPSFVLGLLLIILSVSLLVMIFAICFSLFVSNVVTVGKCRYFSISTLEQRNAGFEELFAGFKRGRYMNIVKTQFFRDLYEFLWGLLFFIPGIIKHYEYYMVPYLLAEYPTMDRREVFRLSKVMMDGNKLDTWVLELSFIGWYLLGMLLCCMGGIFVHPYREATIAELYLKLREDRLGIPRNILPSPGPADMYQTTNGMNPYTNGNGYQ